jgi:glucuronosyltransferase
MLGKELQTFADEAKDGFIIFTLGSLVPVSEMSEEDLKAFMGAFAKIPQKIIWKWEAEIPADLSSNIMMTKWLPQQDLLGISL